MRRLTLRLVIAGLLMLAGWSLAKAQHTQPDFEIVISAPGGSTSVECRRGCKLAWFERGLNPNAATMSKFDFACTGDRCSSGVVGGWLPR